MTQSPKRVFITDCEGPVTKNDNAAELSEAFIPQGDRFFAKISLYDDYLAEVVRRPGYKAGDTLRLILPFFKAFGLDYETMVRFSGREIAVIPGADVVLSRVVEVLPAYIVSTSYSPYIEEVCRALHFPIENTYSTAVNLDDYSLSEAERTTLVELHASILNLPDFIIPAAATSPEDLPADGRETLARLDEIFWTDLPRLDIYRIVEEVNPIGGREKARAVTEIAAKEGVDLSQVLYVGDSITDVEAFRLVKAGDGMALSFNGNDWAVREASFAVTARSAEPIGWIAALFAASGPAGFEDLMMEAITPSSSSGISKKSSRVRKEVRTEKIGSLG